MDALYGTVGGTPLEASVEESEDAVKAAYENGMDAESFSEEGGDE